MERSTFAERVEKALRDAERTIELVKQDSFKPPQAVASAAKLGLELRREFNRGGTAVGVARARDLANRRSVSVKTLKRMRSFFARHGAQVDRRDEGWENRENPSPQWIAWLLWGGDPGRDWAERLLRQMD